MVNGATAIYFRAAAFASAFVARWCLSYRVETTGGVLEARKEEPTPRVPLQSHSWPR
ncbi:MAG TPA: hypothetical protein VGF34_04555 [Stellaceae bacterium]